MNIVEQLQTMGFQDEPVKLLYDGGETESGPGGTDVGSEVSSDYGGTGPSAGDTVGQGALTGPSTSYDPSSETAALQQAIELGLAVANTPTQQAQVEQALSNALAGSLTPSDISALNAAGLGPATGFNINNPTQSVEEMQAAQNVGRYAVPAVISMMPGVSTLTSAAQLASNVASGKFSPGATLIDMAFGAIANQFGISKDTAIAMANGNYGRAASNVVNGALNAAIAEKAGPLSGVVNFGMNISGANKALGNEIASAVNTATGATPTNNVGAMGRSFDQAIGFTPGAMAFGAPASEQLASSQMVSSDIFGTLGGLGFEEPPNEEEKEKLKQLLEQLVPYGTRG